MNGIVISQQSSVLLALVQQQNEVYLDQFVGEEEGVRECIALLYGAEVELNIGNIGTVLKFSVLHEIQEMFQLAIRWVGRNVCEENLGKLLNHALLIETLGKEKVLKIEDVFFELFNFIKNHVKDDLLKLAKDWKIINRKCLIFFLIHPHILDFTLPLLTVLIEGDSDIQEMSVHLERELEHGNISLNAHGDKALDLLDKMSNKVESLETSKRVMKLQKAYCRSEKNSHQKVVSMGKGEPVGEINRSCSDKQTDRYGIDLSLDITSTTKEVPSCSSGVVVDKTFSTAKEVPSCSSGVVVDKTFSTAKEVPSCSSGVVVDKTFSTAKEVPSCSSGVVVDKTFSTAKEVPSCSSGVVVDKTLSTAKEVPSCSSGVVVDKTFSTAKEVPSCSSGVVVDKTFSTAKEVPSCSSGEVPYNLGSDDSQEVQKVLQIQLWIPRKDNRIVETNCLELLVNMADIEVLDCKPSLFGDLVLTISGTQQNCLAAERIVLMTVDKKYIGLIIGKGGRSIREIRNKFGVSVEIIQHKALDNVILTGAQLPVKKAMKYIIHITSCY